MGKHSSLLAWLEKADGDHPKHKSFAHALTTAALFHPLVFGAGWVVDVLTATRGEILELEPAVALPAVIGLISYWSLLIGVRFGLEMDGWVLVIYEMAWSCNASLLFAAASVAMRRPALLCASGMLVAIDQVLWYVDILGYFLIGKMPVKVIAYLFWPSTTVARKITCFHHIFFVPLVVGLCTAGGRLPLGRGFLVSFVETLVCQMICRFMTPLELPHKRLKDGPYYLNINLCYEAFRDVKVAWIRRYDRASPEIYLPWMLWIWNLGNILLFSAFACPVPLLLHMLGITRKLAITF